MPIAITLFQTILGIILGVAMCQTVPMGWIEDLFAMFNGDRFAIIGKVLLGLVLFFIGFAFGQAVAIILIIYVIFLAFVKK